MVLYEELYREVLLVELYREVLYVELYREVLLVELYCTVNNLFQSTNLTKPFYLV